MKITGDGKLLRIFLGESDHHHGRVLYERRNPARLLIGFHGYAQTAEAIVSRFPSSKSMALNWG